MPAPISLPDRPPALAAVPHRRFWGERTPPKNRAAMFSTSVTAAASEDAPSEAGSGGSVATLRLYGPIDSWGGFWGISAEEVSEALDSLGDDVTEIRVRVNSPGGEVWEGLAILNMLRAHKARVLAVVDGLAASAASFIAAGCDETVMSPGTQMMIHDASVFAWGNAASMRKTAEILDSVSNSVASIYAEAAGGTDAQWRAAMVEETWYTAQEAATAGLADRVAVIPDAGDVATAGAGQDEPGDDFEDRFDLSIYQYAGRANAPAPTLPAASASGSTPPAGPDAASGDTTQEGDAAMSGSIFSDEQLATLRQRIGVAADADAATTLAALDEILEEQADPAPSATAPEGMVLLDEAAHAALVSDATAGREARNEQLRAHRAGLVEAAVRDGRIPPSRREHWASLLEADPGAEQTLASLAKGVVPVDELGHSGQLDPQSAGDDELYASLFPKEA